jgi:EmrB/QacA subfamily drug resistance transporter
MVTAILGSSMAFIDGTAVSVSLPTMRVELGASVAGAQLIVDLYLLLLSSLLLVGGALGDRRGRRLVFAVGVGLFTVASVLCGLAPGIGWLLGARALQGIGGALLVPGSLSLITSAIPRERRGRAIGLWSGFTAITAAVGPLLGGVLTELASWRWIFFVNVPLALLIAAVIPRVPESRAPATGALDWPGALLATAGLGGVMFGLIRWPDAPILIAGVVGVALFVAREATARDPLVPPSLFRSRAFTGANVVTLFLYAALGGVLFFIPFELIEVRGYSAARAGAALVPFVGLVSVLSTWAGKLVDRHGARRPLILGPLISAAAFALLARAPAEEGDATAILIPLLVLGLGMATTIAPLTTTVMGAVPTERAGLASGINNAVARAASMLGVAFFGWGLRGDLQASFRVICFLAAGLAAA